MACTVVAVTFDGIESSVAESAEPTSHSTPYLTTVRANQADRPNSPEKKVSDTSRWALEEVAAAQAECIKLLSPIVAIIRTVPPIKSGGCGAPSPLVLESVGSGLKVAFKPPVTVTCPMIAALHDWLETIVQPAAQEAFNEPISSLTGVSAYQCRDQVGGEKGELSEHAFANAIDVSGFTTRSGLKIDVLRTWGSTVRVPDATAEEREAPVRGGENGKKQPGKEQSARPAASVKDKVGTKNLQGVNRGRQPAVPIQQSAQQNTGLAFLKGIHRGACKIFSTVLGPEANADHLDHFHLDLSDGRGRNSSCE
ncbi:MAG: extensin family protein [Hyphomicrobium aestuarii]|nr:extensin family protein [Hyphomicrobium aestuarii]